MKNIIEIPILMAELLESNVDLETAVFTDRGREIINEISDFAEQSQIFKDNAKKGEAFDGLTVRQVFAYMLDRCVNAPTILHRYGSVILIMPFVRKKLMEDDE